MTDAQKAAFTQIEQIAREHFTAALFIAEGDAEGVPNPDNCSDIECTFHGGYTSSIGLARLAELKVYKTELDRSNG